MAQGIGLAGGYGAGGVRDALVDLIAQRMAQAEFDEKRRQASNAETLARETLGQRKTEAGMEDVRAGKRLTFDKTAHGENLGLNIRRVEQDATQHGERMGLEREGLEFRKGESTREQGNKDRSFGLDEMVAGSNIKHQRAMEGIAGQRVAGSGGGTKDATQLGAIAEMVLQNPDLLKDFTPTDRSRILGHIATNKEGALPNKRADSMRSMVDASLDTIGRLEGMSGMSGAVGAKGPTSLFGLLEKPIAGSGAADYASYVDALKSQLTLPRMEMMRGLGAMSDREFKTLSDSATALNRNMSETEFVRELGNIKATLAGVRERMGGAAGAGGDPGAGQQFDFDPTSGKLVPRGGR
jgi:hypothetical protein